LRVCVQLHQYFTHVGTVYLVRLEVITVKTGLSSKRLTVKIADFMFRHGMATLIRVCERGVRPREQRRVLRV